MESDFVLIFYAVYGEVQMKNQENFFDFPLKCRNVRTKYLHIISNHCNKDKPNLLEV